MTGWLRGAHRPPAILKSDHVSDGETQAREKDEVRSCIKLITCLLSWPRVRHRFASIFPLARYVALLCLPPLCFCCALLCTRLPPASHPPPSTTLRPYDPTTRAQQNSPNYYPLWRSGSQKLSSPPLPPTLFLIFLVEAALHKTRSCLLCG
jgi:hypothetical protein